MATNQKVKTILTLKERIDVLKENEIEKKNFREI
jgi:hypothetical protein